MTFSLLSLAAFAAPRHPCTPAEDLGPGRYARRSLVVFPLEVDPAGIVVTGAWSGPGPDGVALADAQALVGSVASGLFSVDWPLRRFDAWTTSKAPGFDESGALEPRSTALACADAAVVPRLVAAEISVAGASAKVHVTMELAVYQRDEARQLLVLTDTLRADAPGLVDRVEDAMVTARRQSVDRVMAALPIQPRALDAAESGSAAALELLPDDQRAAVAAVAEQGALAVTRVASAARPALVLPMLEIRAPNPGAQGLRWRAEEDRCYVEPPDDEHPERALPCAALSRVRQAVRELQLQTRRIEAFRLTGPMDDGATPIGEAEGVGVGDGYWVAGPDGRAGYARVRRVGDGGADGAVAPTRLQVVYGPRRADGLSLRENPQLGLEVGGSGGILPARRPDAALPVDPIDGDARALDAAAIAPAGTLRFDVNLGRAAGLYEWYQTNRLARGLAGPLQHTAATFGIERRVQVLPRTSLLAGVGVTVGTWSIPSGAVRFDDEGEPHELRASATRIGGDGELGISWTVSPSLLVRATGGARVAGPVESFTWSDDDRSGTVVPASAEPFRLSTTGAVAAVSTSWVF